MRDASCLADWQGRSETRHDSAAIGPLRGLEATLDHDLDLGSGRVPPLGHWLYFLPTARQADLDEDGHPARGDFLPPVDLPRRMWAGGGLVFHRPIAIGAAIERRSTIANVEEKNGASGRLVFVTVEHRIASDGQLAIEERQDIVYREPAGPQIGVAPAGRPVLPPRDADAVRQVRPTAALLFRYSALTFNAHRIHYDRDYARDIEGYPGLVVHGPLAATFLMDLFLSQKVGAPRRFEFRARSPLFDDARFETRLAWTEGGAELWTLDANGQTTMSATVVTG